MTRLNYLSAMTSFRLVPSARLRVLVDAMGGTYAASQAWGVQYRSLQRFLEGGGGGGLLGDTIATILERSRLDYSSLFAHKAGGRKTGKPA